MNQNKALWENGDFTRIAASMRESGEALARSFGIRSGTKVLAAFRSYYGPTMNAFEAAERSGRAADLHQELEDLFNRQNASQRNDATCIPATFLRVTVTV